MQSSVCGSYFIQHSATTPTRHTIDKATTKKLTHNSRAGEVTAIHPPFVTCRERCGERRRRENNVLRHWTLPRSYSIKTRKNSTTHEGRFLLYADYAVEYGPRSHQGTFILFSPSSLALSHLCTLLLAPPRSPFPLHYGGV